MLSFILGIIVGVALGWNISPQQVVEKFNQIRGK